MKAIYGRNGIVTNYVSVPEPASNEEQIWFVDDNFVVNVGDPFDTRDVAIDAVDVASFRVHFRHENMLRQIIRTLRTNAGLNTQATNNGLPLSVNVPDLTLVQAREAFKLLVPQG
jgi:hypothetical protein